ncbi:hypothetical protein KDM41_04500 [bacterium]|nr:hypothetical protein [bacterium]
MQAKNPTPIALAAALLLAVAGAPVVRAGDPGLLRPTVQYTNPSGISATGVKLVPPTITIEASASDPDAPGSVPARYRYLVKEAIDAQGQPIRTPTEYQLHHQEVLALDDPGWTAWQDYPHPYNRVEIPLVGLTDGAYYLVSLQILDFDGLSNDPWLYQDSALHLKVIDGFFRPLVVLSEPFLGTSSATETVTIEIAGGQPLNFSWTASADLYGADIASMRHGWDLVDPDDPGDPGWAVPPGLAAVNGYAAERIFQEGIHTFTVRVVDTAGAVTLTRRTLRVVPYVDPAFQFDLLVLDQVVDENVQTWPDRNGVPRDDESFRNSFWQFLDAVAGGAVGFDWNRDWRDHADLVEFSDVVAYKAVLCYARFHDTSQRLFTDPLAGLRPVNDQDRFLWLSSYQARGGNVMLVGDRSLDSFHEGKPNYMIPFVYDTAEETYVVNGQPYVVGFGSVQLPDGSTVLRGPRQYAYATAGIAALDWTAPATKFIYGRPTPARFDRTADCVGLKGLVLDGVFAANHLVGGAIPDTIWTDPEIDWRDADAAAGDSLSLASGFFPFRDDEFIDANISSRPTPIVAQDCLDGPGGLCVEPMFRGVSRFDYVREIKRAGGDADWPQSEYAAVELESVCGPLALTAYEGEPDRSARTNGQVYGFLSYKSVADKPSGKADVYWGFDPYRFDHESARQAVRWALDYFGLQIGQ